MQTKTPWMLAAGMILLAAVLLPRDRAVRAQDRDPNEARRTISTTGTATVTTTPDSARVSFTVQTSGETVAAAREANTVVSNRLRAALTALKIPGLKTKTVDLSVTPVQSLPTAGNKPPRTIGFREVYQLTVLVQNSDREQLSAQAQRVTDAGLGSGALVQQVRFFRENEERVRREALTQAADNGMSNARALARGASVHLLDPVQIDDQPAFDVASTSNAVQAASAPEAPQTLEAGEIQVTCTVRVTCRF